MVMTEEEMKKLVSQIVIPRGEGVKIQHIRASFDDRPSIFLFLSNISGARQTNAC
jgi:hypothetical protein